MNNKEKLEAIKKCILNWDEKEIKWFDDILKDLERLEQIDNTNLSEALMFMQELLNISETEKHFINLANYDTRLYLIKTKQALLKAQEQDKILEILKPNLSADLFNKENETGIIHLAQINIDKNSSQEEKDNFYKVRDYLRK